MNKNPLVSICCAAYNHEEYIEDALRGFLMQECDFEYEILIHDDASTDKTAEIIRRYEKKYPDKIFPIYQTQNQYSQGKKYSDLNYERVRGKYVAICEGDDCWIDKTKLAKQIKLMEANPTFGLCFHPALQLNLTNDVKQNIGEYLDEDGIVDIRDIILKKKGMIPYASCVITKNVLNEVLKFKKIRPYLTVGDAYMHFFGALKAEGALYINEVMSLYRFNTVNSWSIQQIGSNYNQIKHLYSMAKSYQELNKLTNFIYKDSFELSIITRIFSVSHFTSLSDIPDEFLNYKILLLNFLNLLKNQEEKYILYASGVGAKMIMEILGDTIEYIIDKDINKVGDIFFGKKICHINQLSKVKNKKILISLIGRSNEVINELSNKYNINKEQFLNFDEQLIKSELLNKIKFDTKDI